MLCVVVPALVSYQDCRKLDANRTITRLCSVTIAPTQLLLERFPNGILAQDQVLSDNNRP